MFTFFRSAAFLLLLTIVHNSYSQTDLYSIIDENSSAIEEKVVTWRRYLHANPELSNREFETAKYVEKHLRSLGMEVRTGIAHTGVVGILKGGQPGPVIGLRADMDALPVLERVDVDYKSTKVGEFNGEEVPIMHACGHDTHVAILMGAAEVLSGMKDKLKGTVVFVFQPAEEGAPQGEEGGAKLMVAEGVLDDPKIEVMFGLHIRSTLEVGKIDYKVGAAMASADRFTVHVKGKQTHGSRPWGGVDPIVVCANIIQGFQQIISRETPLTKAPAVITVGKIEAGVRENIIPENAYMLGTIRTLDPEIQPLVHARMHRMVSAIASASGAEATLQIENSTLVTYNDEKLTAQMVPTLSRVAGQDNVNEVEWTTGAEDFSFYSDKIPSLFFFLGGMPKGTNPADASPHHTPDFYIDDSELDLGVRAFCNLVVDYSHK